MNIKTKLFSTMLILPSFLFPSVELANNSCETLYSIPQLSGISDDLSHSDDYSNKGSKDIYLSFNTAVDGNFSIELLKDNDKKMKYQLFIGNSCDNLTLIEKTAFEYTHNVNLAISANQEYIIKIVKHSNGNSRYNITYNFVANKAEIIHGYTLPPEPDPAINNSTILGIDVNNNGIRDDVERYIIKRFAQEAEFPKTKIAIALQYAWASQKILENPTMDSKQYIDNAIDCQYYWFHRIKKENRERIMELSKNNMELAIQEDIKLSKWQREHKVFNDPLIKDKIYNTRERIEQKFLFNSALSGNIFNGRSKPTVSVCKINIDKLGE